MVLNMSTDPDKYGWEQRGQVEVIRRFADRALRDTQRYLEKREKTLARDLNRTDAPILRGELREVRRYIDEVGAMLG